MTTIASTDFATTAAGARLRTPRGVWVRYRLLRRRWHLQLWYAQARRELRDDRLLADIGVSPGSERKRVVALARAMGASSRREF